MTEGCCTRSTDTGIHTHTHQHSRLTLSTPTASSMSATTVMLAVAYKWCGRRLRSRNCGVDQYMHGPNFLTTSWFLASSIVYILEFYRWVLPTCLTDWRFVCLTLVQSKTIPRLAFQVLTRFSLSLSLFGSDEWWLALWWAVLCQLLDLDIRGETMRNALHRPILARLESLCGTEELIAYRSRVIHFECCGVSSQSFLVFFPSQTNSLKALPTFWLVGMVAVLLPGRFFQEPGVVVAGLWPKITGAQREGLQWPHPDCMARCQGFEEKILYPHCIY